MNENKYSNLKIKNNIDKIHIQRIKNDDVIKFERKQNECISNVSCVAICSLFIYLFILFLCFLIYVNFLYSLYEDFD